MKLNELFALFERHNNPSILKSLELELLPIFSRKFEFDCGKLIKMKTKDFVLIKTHKDEWNTFDIKYNSDKEKQSEINSNQLTRNLHTRDTIDQNKEN